MIREAIVRELKRQHPTAGTVWMEKKLRGRCNRRMIQYYLSGQKSASEGVIEAMLKALGLRVEKIDDFEP